MQFSELPTEIIRLIADISDSQCAINALAQVNRSLHSQLNPFLYLYHVRCNIQSPALSWAAKHGNLGTLQKLLVAGVDIYCAPLWNPDSGPTRKHPINIAASKGHAGIVELLLDTGMRYRLTNTAYNMILRLAVIENRTSVIKLLLSQGVDPWHIEDGKSSICCAAARGHAEVVKLLLLDAEQRRSLEDSNKSREIGRALRISAGGPDNTDIVGMLLAAGADVNFRENDHATALGVAATFKNLDNAKVLLQNGADPNMTYEAGSCPLADAVLHNHFWWNRYTSSGRRYVRYPRRGTPLPALSHEMKEKMMALVQLLFKYGAHPAHSGGILALHRALQSQNNHMAHILIYGVVDDTCVRSLYRGVLSGLTQSLRSPLYRDGYVAWVTVFYEGWMRSHSIAGLWHSSAGASGIDITGSIRASPAHRDPAMVACADRLQVSMVSSLFYPALTSAPVFDQHTGLYHVPLVILSRWEDDILVSSRLIGIVDDLCKSFGGDNTLLKKDLLRLKVKRNIKNAKRWTIIVYFEVSATTESSDQSSGQATPNGSTDGAIATPESGSTVSSTTESVPIAYSY
ncbi:Ankyrin repeat domain-containing protein 44 [Aspergillus nanangensis]|uniref:Ankyrin repeat domain-containing protein 44 n=1 Tax=Aspergillus nanangensis TaxID=2582783 RepID=A0AAD4CD02_ASPNN|nr:Ankyrin repeat domain-containing protein 44 [Aspergillus nanangensis]